MSAWSSQKKISGTPGALINYYREEMSEKSVDDVLGYYATPADGVIFRDVAGGAAAHLPGLDLARGLTKEQFVSIFNGKWQGQQLVKGGYRPVYDVTKDPDTGRTVKTPRMVDVVDAAGEVVKDPLTGKPKQKKDMEQAFVSGYDVTFALDKSSAEYLVAHPEQTDVIRACFLEAVNTAMKIGVEDHCELVAKTVQKPTEVVDRHTRTQGSATRMVKAEGLLWFVVFGNSARPTDLSRARGYEVDPHLHAHCFLSSMAHVGGGKFQKIDGNALFKTAEVRASIASTTYNRLLEEHGIRIEYAEPDRKGRIYTQIEGSDTAVRDFLSTNRKRAWELKLDFEKKYNRSPDGVETRELMAVSRGRKTDAAKKADQLGNRTQVDKWRRGLSDAGLEIHIPPPGDPVPRESVDDRLDLLYERLDRPDGVARDVGSACMFPDSVVLPTVWRSAEGLGFDDAQLVMAADTYIAARLIPMLRRNEDGEEVPWLDQNGKQLYTTRALVDAEHLVQEALDAKARTVVPEVPLAILEWTKSQLPYELDEGQARLVDAVCGDQAVVHGLGNAGAGKTATMIPAVKALRQSRIVDEVVVISPARKRANETGAAVKANKSWSVEALRYYYDRGWRAKPSTLVIVDESITMSVFDTADVLRRIGFARLVTIGDTKQAASLGPAGHWNREFEERPAVKLTENYRQKEEKERQALQLLREGDPHTALETLAELGHVIAARDDKELEKLVQARWEHYIAAGVSPNDIAFTLVAGRNTDLDTYCGAIQRSRLDAGKLEGQHKVDLVEKGSGRQWRLYVGDRVIFNKGLYFGLDDPIANGVRGEVLRITPDAYRQDITHVRLRLDGEERRTLTIEVSREDLVQPICPGYVTQMIKQQGAEVPVNIAIAGPSELVSLQSAYSALSRGQDVNELLLSREMYGEHPLVSFSEAISRVDEKHMVTPYLDAFDRPVEDLSLVEDLHIDDLDLERTPAMEAAERIRDLRTRLDEGISHSHHL